ncbi:glucans biosynthesis glucosyltransferase MdoH [Halomonas sp. 18H]|uniref:glucans biosynthesis glucosyltransferase MdoH n=1 Tax=Halomonas almeriensis TaxID=308163 RepID=UPI00222ED4E9|nr:MULTISPECIES: glucans biosynthesis glucosyltransferase MdoH [Halomonas]MCW4149208.1 glucans biosynthesis glucosyltransferase MdoH [Halomonas sp. 18H]
MSAAESRAMVAPVPFRRTRRLIFALLVAATTMLGLWTMFRILHVGGLTPLELAVMALFTVTFGWIAVAFWSGLIGFALSIMHRDPLSLARAGEPQPPDTAHSVTALVMPIHNEDVERVAAGLEATCRDLPPQTAARRIEAFVLSDSTDADCIAREQAAMAALQQRLADHCRLHYRHRDSNAGRKAGNLGDFCERWGAHYDFMLVLDADSLMSGDTIHQMIAQMEANPNLGILQTVPIPVRQDSLFGRANQFAAAVYSPMLATGLSFWQSDAANYFGHNAILRVAAFTAHCGLPELPGRPPLGGDILSHDFVEAALLRRAGWEVRMRTDLGGSFEEMPSHILDYAKRDRRWVQGNLQHLRLLGGSGLHMVSRVHFLCGALAYLSSLVWLAILVVSTADALLHALIDPNFFTSDAQLFPDWPISPPNLIMPLLGGTLAMLLMPKVLGVALVWRQSAAAFGGRARLLASALLEALFAILIAPLMMVFHSRFVVEVLCGRTVAWNAQPREGRALPWRDAIRYTWPGTLVGTIWAGVTWWYTPGFFWWLTPIWLGLLLAAPLVRFSSSLTIGQRLRRRGLLLVPSETSIPAVLSHLAGQAPLEDAAELTPPPAEYRRAMPLQSFAGDWSLAPGEKKESATGP